MDLDAELEKFMFELYDKVHHRHPVIFDKIIKYEGKCLEEAEDDPEVYVRCMRKLNKTIEHNEHAMAFKTEHAIIKATACMHEHEKDKEGLDQCKKTAFDQIDKYIKDFNNSF